jgi:hypothetical protein
MDAATAPLIFGDEQDARRAALDNLHWIKDKRTKALGTRLCGL